MENSKNGDNATDDGDLIMKLSDSLHLDCYEEKNNSEKKNLHVLIEPEVNNDEEINFD